MCRCFLYRLSVAITVLFFFCTSVLATDGTQRFALVIGNQSYQAAPLKHALNDARSIAVALRDAGFQVTTLIDVNGDKLKQGVTAFYDSLQAHPHAKRLAVIYYAGHAIQINHVNYLIPLDINFDSQDDFFTQLYNLTDLFTHMQQDPALQNVVILDACRNNPFEQNTQILSSRGLAPVDAPPGTLIAFATEPGGVASDGRSKNGVYTKHLLRYIGNSLPVEEVFKKVRSGVARETQNRQIPWEHSSLLNEVYFSAPKNKDMPDIVVF